MSKEQKALLQIVEFRQRLRALAREARLLGGMAATAEALTALDEPLALREVTARQALTIAKNKAEWEKRFPPQPRVLQ
ncbi:MAG: hypothetical protein QM723_05250 [Myxococcaceae bacterium]